jgi:hypothetical protein
MKILTVAISSSLLVVLTGCGVGDLAKNATDAAACKALSSTIGGITTAYQSGLIDSGLSSQINSLVGDQARSLLSTGLAEDIGLLIDALGKSQTAQGSQENIESITASITKRCSDVGVTIGN